MTAKSEAASLLLSAEGHLDEDDTRQALEEAKKVLELAESIKDMTLSADATRIVIGAHRREAERSQVAPEEAERIAQEGLERYRSLGRAREEAVMLLSLSEINAERRGSRRRTMAERSANQAVDIFKSLGEKTLEAAALNQLATISRLEKDVAGALERSREAVAIAQEATDLRMEALCLHGLAVGQAANSQFEDALQTEEAALPKVQDLGIKKMEATALCQMANWNLALGKAQLALTLAQKALAAKAGNQETLVKVIALAENGKAHEALDAAKDGIVRAKKLGDKREEVGALRVLVRAHLGRGDIGQAMKAYEDALAILRDLGDRTQEFQMLHAMAVLYMDRGAIQKAETPLREAASIAEGLAEKGMTLRVLSELRIDMEQYAEALATAHEAQKAFQEDGDRSGEASALMLMASAHNLSGDSDKAISVARLAYEMVFIAGDFKREAIVLQMLAELYLAQGKVDEAVESLLKATDASKEGGDVRGAARTMNMIGELYCDGEALAEAEQMARDAQQQFAVVADSEGDAFSQLLLARINIKNYQKYSNDWFLTQTRMASSQAVMSAGKTRNIFLQASASSTHAQALMMGTESPPEEALRLAKRAQALYKECGDARGEALSMIVVASFLLSRRENDRAKDILEKALALARSGGDAEAERSAQEALDAIEAAKSGRAPVARGRPGPGGEAALPPAALAGGGEASAGAGGSMAIAKLDPVVVKNKLMDLVRNAIGTGEDVEADSALMDAGMDSLSATDFTGQVAREFRLGTSPSLVFDFPTLREIVNHVMEESGSN